LIIFEKIAKLLRKENKNHELERIKISKMQQFKVLLNSNGLDTSNILHIMLASNS